MLDSAQTGDDVTVRSFQGHHPSLPHTSAITAGEGAEGVWNVVYLALFCSISRHYDISSINACSSYNIFWCCDV